MKIFVRAVIEGELILEEIEATAVNGFDSIAVAHVNRWWNVYDIPTGLRIVSGETKKAAIENLLIRKFQVEQTRRTELYQKRIKEFEAMKKL